jgi:hypothetical protein
MKVRGRSDWSCHNVVVPHGNLYNVLIDISYNRYVPRLFKDAVISTRKSRRLRWAGHVARMGERRGAHRALVGKPERK